MQWFPAGGGARHLINLLTPATSKLRRLRIRHHAGRTDRIANICTILTRSDHRAATLLANLSPTTDTATATAITGAHHHTLNTDQPLPWDFITHDRHKLVRSYTAMRQLLDHNEPLNA